MPWLIALSRRRTRLRCTAPPTALTHDEAEPGGCVDIRLLHMHDGQRPGAAAPATDDATVVGAGDDAVRPMQHEEG